jgi:hypothetical protein
MKIDFSYLLANSFSLIDNNIESTIEKLISDRFKFSVYGRLPNSEKDDFFVIDQVHVLNATFDIETDLYAQPKASKWEREDDFFERFKKKMTVLYILSHPLMTSMISPRIYYLADLHITGRIDRNRTISIIEAKIDREEMVPNVNGIAVPESFKRYLTPRFVDIYKEILIARNNRMKNSIVLLSAAFIDEYLSEELGIDPSLPVERKIANLKDPDLKSLLECATTPGNTYAGCMCGKNIKEITDTDVEKIVEFIHVFVENSIGPKKAAEVQAKTKMIMIESTQNAGALRQ